MKERCFWVNLKNDKYVDYHDNEWGEPVYDDKILYEMLILESFQAGLSWETILNKREAFKLAFDNFDINKVSQYQDDKVDELLLNAGIIRHEKKIRATINNSKLFLEIQKEFGSFKNYIWKWTDNKIIYTKGELVATSKLSDEIAKDLKKRGFKFLGSTTIYAYLQGVGIINDHSKECYKYKEE